MNLQSESPGKAPKITEEDLDKVIVTEMYHLFPGTTTTCCCLILENGYTVVGESACAHPDNFDAEYGKKLARQKARNKIWELEGYRLRSELAATGV